MQLVVFSIGGKEYALPITEVQEIIRYVEPRPVSAGASWIRGVISLRGKIVPVCDLAARLGLVEEDEADAPKIVIVENASNTVGVIVDEVDEVLIVGEEQLDRVPGAGSDLIDMIAKVDDKLVLLLEPTRLFDGLELAEASA